MEVSVTTFLSLFEASIKCVHELPTGWATALMYGDYAAYSFEERVRILHWLKTNGLCCAQDMSDEETRLGYSEYTWLT